MGLDRPRSVRAHQAVLTATGALLTEGGFRAATVDAISERSGVSKATIYKHWPSRTAVAAEAFALVMAEAVPLPDSGDARADLLEQVRRVNAFYSSGLGVVFGELLAACVGDAEGARYFRELFLEGRRREIRVLWERALVAGVGDPSVDVEVAIDILFGPLVFRRMTGHAELSDDAAVAIAHAAFRGLLR